MISKISKSLKRNKVHKFIFKASEENKNIFCKKSLTNLLNKNFSRQDCLITIGGELLEMLRFAASLYKRGLLCQHSNNSPISS